jgi:DNA-binding transcriptional ArsR family regulator
MKEFSNEAYYLIFSTLANRTNLGIIDILKDGPKTISEILSALKQEQAIVSDNLKQLEKSVLIISDNLGNEQVYSLNKEIIEPLAHVLELYTAKHCPGLRECISQEKLRDYMKKEAAKETFIEH